MELCIPSDCSNGNIQVLVGNSRFIQVLWREVYDQGEEWGRDAETGLPSGLIITGYRGRGLVMISACLLVL